jgi:Uma2 family endonuclease
MREPRSDLGPLRLDEYLAWETNAHGRHEFVSGRVYSLAGATARHNTIVQNIADHGRKHAVGGPCKCYLIDLKVRTPGDRVYYPDVVIDCSAHDGSTVVIDAPCLLVEVCSPTTRRIDRGEKLDAYLTIPSLEAYLIVESERRHATLYSRAIEAGWRRDEIVSNGSITLPCLGSMLSLDEVYADADPPLRVREDPEDEIEDGEYSDLVEINLTE